MRMPPGVLEFVHFFWRNLGRIYPRTLDGQYYVKNDGQRVHWTRFKDKTLLRFVPDEDREYWVQFYEEAKNKIVWTSLDNALATDMIQVIYEIMIRGMVFHDDYWWFVEDYDDIFLLEASSDSEIEVIDLMDSDSDDDDEVHVINVVPA